MKSRTLAWITTITLLVGLAIPVGMATQGQNQQHNDYVIVDLGTLGGTFGEANAVSNKGSVAGDATLFGDTVRHAFLWRKGLTRDLDTLGGLNSRATSLNEEDEVTGISDISTPDPLGEDFCGFGTNLVCLPFIWQNGTMVPLPTLGGSNGQAFAINSRGQVAGMAETETLDATCESGSEFPQVEPVLWEKGEIHRLPTIAGDPDGAVHAINDNGQAVGNTLDCTGSSFHAVRWQHGKAIDLGSLDGLLLAPQAINSRGQVAGFAFSPDGSVLVAFLWQNGVATNLGTLPPDAFSLALGINDKGQIVGDSCDADFSCRAFLWQNGAMTELNDLVHNPNAPFLENGNSINSLGQIAGKTTVQGTPIADAFLATPRHCEGTHGTGAGERPKGVSPEKVRRMLRQRLGSRYQIPFHRSKPRN
jgi:probable HAF family extracellular repeat protein